MTSTQIRSTARAGRVRSATLGAGAGAIASVPMLGYAMAASYVKDTGFFTPLHHIASVVAAPDPMMGSMTAGMEGDAFVVTAGTALLGLAIHVMTGAAYGAILGVVLGAVAGRLRLGGARVIGIGLVFGALVFAFSAFIGLPLAAEVTGAGEPIAGMASMAGWWTFVVEHLLFGVVAAVLVAALLRKRP